MTRHATESRELSINCFMGKWMFTGAIWEDELTEINKKGLGSYQEALDTAARWDYEIWTGRKS